MKVESSGMPEVAGADVLGTDGGAEDVFFCVAATSRCSKKRISYFHTNTRGEDAEAARARAPPVAPPHRRRGEDVRVPLGRRRPHVLRRRGPDAEVVRFLERVCDAAPRRRLRDDTVAPVARQFAQALRAAAGAGSSSAADAALLGASPVCDKDEEPDRAESAEPGRPSWWRSWRRHAVVVIGVDVVVCLVLLAVWMGVCHGFKCLTR